MDAGTHDPNDPELLAHERTYKGFNVLLRWCMVLLAVSILTLTLWFATPAGFIGAVAVGFVTFIVGYWGLIRHEAHQPLDPWTPGR